MNDTVKIFVDNLKAALQQVQRYLYLGLGAAVYYLVLCFSALEKAEVPTPAPFSVSTDVDFAKAIALAISFLAGAMASYSADRAKRITDKITQYSNVQNDIADLLGGLRTFPSIVTEPYPLVRIGASVIIALIIAVGRLKEVTKTEGFEWEGLSISILVLTAPYMAIAVQLWSPPFAEGSQVSLEDTIGKEHKAQKKNDFT